MNPTQQHLQSLIQDVRNQSPKTLAALRLASEPLVRTLESFASSSNNENNDNNNNNSNSNSTDEKSSDLYEETLQLFDQLNPLLAQQERELPEVFVSSDPVPANSHRAIVFGGKYAAPPRSISEALIKQLLQFCPQVWTVSRSTLDSEDLPSNLTHIACHSLDLCETIESGTTVTNGQEEFRSVIEKAFLTVDQAGDHLPLTIYFTLGQHKGENPFQRNLQAAHNFAQALKVMGPQLVHSQWDVVLTGTDATLPSTHPDTVVTLSDTDETTASPETFVRPTYKIMEYNYTYAMSKIAQYYIVAQAIAELLGQEAVAQQCQSAGAKLQAHVLAAGEDGNYHHDTALVSMEDLDRLSQQVTDSIVPALQQHLSIATGISICYTPLHARPWTEQAMKQDTLDPKAFVLEQIVKRFKNAMSIDQAVACHFSRG